MWIYLFFFKYLYILYIPPPPARRLCLSEGFAKEVLSTRTSWYRTILYKTTVCSRVQLAWVLRDSHSRRSYIWFMAVVSIRRSVGHARYRRQWLFLVLWQSTMAKAFGVSFTMIMRNIGLFLSLVLFQAGVVRSEIVPLDIVLDASADEVHYIRGKIVQ